VGGGPPVTKTNLEYAEKTIVDSHSRCSSNLRSGNSPKKVCM